MRKTEVLPMPMRLDKRFAIKPQSKRDRVVKLHESGMSISKLAAKFNVAFDTIKYIVNENFRMERREANRNNVPTVETLQEYKRSRKEREPQIRQHYAMGLTQNA